MLHGSVSWEELKEENKMEQNRTKRDVLKLKITCFLCLAFALLFGQFGFAAEDPAKFPSRPITFIEPIMAGSTADITARLISKAAEKYLGQPVVVVNKTGAGGAIGLAAIAAAKPDGYTVGYTSPSCMFISPFVEKMPYHPLNDLQQIIQYSEFNFSISVKGNSPFKDFKQLIAYARQNPNKLTYGTTGTLSLAHIAIVQVAKKENVKFNNLTFKGSPESMAALLGGHVDFVGGDFNYALLDAGEIRLLAIIGENRNAWYPQVPTLKDLGYSEVPPATIYHNIAGPKGIPQEIVRKLEEAFTLAMKEPSFINGLKEIRFPVIYRNSKDMTDYIARNYEFYEKIIKEMGLSKK